MAAVLLVTVEVSLCVFFDMIFFSIEKCNCDEFNGEIFVSSFRQTNIQPIPESLDLKTKAEMGKWFTYPLYLHRDDCANCRRLHHFEHRELDDWAMVALNRDVSHFHSCCLHHRRNLENKTHNRINSFNVQCTLHVPLPL